ncbi:MAG TPA: deoxyribonuclease IV [Thermoleophilia bacterium]|nr:deoxyribonuclease IV [Thermoleophilia bacterium]
MYFGAHVKASGGVWTAIDHAEELHVQAIQFFAGSPRTWKPQLYREPDAARFRERRAASDLRFALIHTIYLINLATTNEDFYEKSVVALVGAVTAAEQLGAEAIVTHIGSHQGAGFEAGLDRVREALCRALDQVGDSKVRLLLENTAGAGGTMGVTFEHLAAMIDATGGDERLGVCLDTAHMLASGHELRTEQGLDATLESFRHTVGLERLVAVHLNDSKSAFASNRDRHENIGDGEIGREAMGRLVNHPAFAGIPGILEVPGYDDKGPDAANIDTLRALVHKED